MESLDIISKTWFESSAIEAVNSKQFRKQKTKARIWKKGYIGRYKSSFTGYSSVQLKSCQKCVEMFP